MTELDQILRILKELNDENFALKKQLRDIEASRNSPTLLSSLQSLSSLRSTAEESKTDSQKKTLDRTVDTILAYAKATNFI